jgi:hypothetical protein
MTSAVIVVIGLALVAAWHAFISAQSGGRGSSPLWMAFNCTAASVLFLLAGLSGYTLSGHARFLANTAWAGEVIWWQVAVGFVAAVAACFFWRRGLRHPARRLPSRA